MDLVVDQNALELLRNLLPNVGRIGVRALQNEDAAALQTGQRIGVQEHIRIGRKHHVHVEVVAVHADRLRRRGQVVGGRLALLFRTVFRVRFDVVTQQVKQRHRQVLTSGDGAPAADGMEPHGDAVLRHQVRILAAMHRQRLQPRVGVGHLDLMDLLFRRERLVVHEVDRQVEELPFAAVRQHVFNGANQPFRLQVAAAEPERPRIQWRHIFGFFIARVALVHHAGAAVLYTAAQRRAHFAD